MAELSPRRAGGWQVSGFFYSVNVEVEGCGGSKRSLLAERPTRTPCWAKVQFHGLVPSASIPCSVALHPSLAKVPSARSAEQRIDAQAGKREYGRNDEAGKSIVATAVGAKGKERLINWGKLEF